MYANVYERRREIGTLIALARMMANNPAIILADEPTGNLDPETSQSVLGFLADLNQEGKTILMVTHDMRAAEKAKRKLWLREGKLYTKS